MTESNLFSYSALIFISLLTAVLVVLKLTKVIGWSWWWILSPLWIALGLLLIVLAIYLMLVWVARD